MNCDTLFSPRQETVCSGRFRLAGCTEVSLLSGSQPYAHIVLGTKPLPILSKASVREFGEFLIRLSKAMNDPT